MPRAESARAAGNDSTGASEPLRLCRRVLLLGAAGFIGSAVLARFAAEGVEVLAVARRRGVTLDGVEWRELDLATLVAPADWLPHLAGVDTVVNCAGVLQGSRALRAVHVDGARALYEACEQARVQRVVHVSAIGVERDAVSEFSATKRLGEQALMATTLEWVVLRPSVVVGRAAYGGSALLRGLAALPFIVDLPAMGVIQLVQLDDLVGVIAALSRRGAPSRLALDVTAPESLELAAVIALYRRWLRFPDAPPLRVPRWIAASGFRLGDFVRLLGWRTPLGAVAHRELTRGTAGDAHAWQELTGVKATPLALALAREPASVQERWFARLYLLKALVLAMLAIFWIATGLITLGPGWEQSLAYLRDAGFGDGVARAAASIGAFADIAIGACIAVRRTARAALFAAVGVSLGYLVAGSFVLPSLWLDPLGPLLKIAPILAATAVALAVVEDR